MRQQQIPSARSPNSLEIAWAAGVFEGEGCVCVPTKTNRAEGAQVAQADPWLLVKFQELFGGIIRFNRSWGNGGYLWTLRGPHARGFLMTIYQFLSPRRKQRVKQCLEGRKDYVRGPYRRKNYTKEVQNV